MTVLNFPENIKLKFKVKYVEFKFAFFKLQDPQAVASARPATMVKAASMGSLLNVDPDGPMTGEMRPRTGSVKSTKSDKSEYNSDKHSMMEFAMQYFRHGR